MAVFSAAQKVDTRHDPIGGLSFSPLQYRIAANPGLSGVLEFNITSPTGKAAEGSMRITSAVVDDWTYRAHYGVANPNDCSSWFAKKEARVLVAGKPVVQQFRYRVPSQARGSYWALLVFSPKPVGSRATMNLIYEVPILMQVGRPETPDIKVAAPRVEGDVGAPSISVGFVNDGNSFGIVGAQCTLRSVLTGHKIAEERMFDKNLYPHTKRRLSLNVSALRPGRYELSVSPEIGHRQLPDLVSSVEVQGQTIVQRETRGLLSVTGVEVQPSGLEASVPPGGTMLGVIRVRNTKGTPANLKIAVTGVEQNASGALGIGNSSPSYLDVSVSPSDLSLPPGGVQSVRLMLKTDRAASGDLWFGLKIGDKSGEGIPQQMLGVVSVKSTLRPQLVLQSEGFEYARDGQPIKLNYAIKNTGNTGLQPRSVAGIISGNRLVNSLAVPLLGDGGIIPGAVLQASVMLPLNMPPGRYEVQVKSRYSKTGVAELAVPFTVKVRKL